MTETSREPIRMLVFAASLQENSLNAKLAMLATSVIEQHQGVAQLATMKDFDCPSFDADVEETSGLPDGAERFRASVESSNAFVICSPEYNASMPGGLKNVIDWVSRYRPQPFNEKHGLLMSASPSMIGGNRGLWSLRVPLEHLGARIYPDMFSLAQAHNAIGDDGRIANDELSSRFVSNIINFMDLVEAATHYPCVKHAWVEYLGSNPDPLFDRVDTASSL
ncbi:MAG: NAD(P)H-dependent oxidoreductase [Acidimicrobiales bacterium]